MALASTLADQVAVEKLGEGEYVARSFPFPMGNTKPIAYGGCALGVAVNAACLTAPPNMSLYSVLGHFHGPASIDNKFYCSVANTRDTRSFATRRVQVKQKTPDGQFRVRLELLADFHVKEPSDFVYSEPPRSPWPRPQDCPDLEGLVDGFLQDGMIGNRQSKMLIKEYGAMSHLFEVRQCTGGVSAQNLSGALKDVVTTQDGRSITDKISAEWQRSVKPLPSQPDHMGALAFAMDSGLSFLPLSHNHMWFDDAAACSTLDFALRIFVPEVKVDEWHVKERRTLRAGSGRTFSESKLWDEHGNLVASNTQQCIMRIKEGVSIPKL
ncbi:hypothetical protein F66182_5422 [Fusarium sp. NRRL 66182]|nr:hypothetical protein F66182_5422 [Fusarium sp. NRRL 66182]